MRYLFKKFAQVNKYLNTGYNKLSVYSGQLTVGSKLNSLNLNAKDFVLMTVGVGGMEEPDVKNLTKFLSTVYLPGFC